ncbi:Down syndrome cell adhesion molecule-like protein Dscam2, partial [Gryllus bimaculatus]
MERQTVPFKHESVFPNGTICDRERQSENDGVYRCVASNKQEMIGCTAQVNVMVSDDSPYGVAKDARIPPTEPMMTLKADDQPRRDLVSWDRSVSSRLAGNYTCWRRTRQDHNFTANCWSTGRKMESYHSLVGHESKQLKEIDVSTHQSGMTLLPNGSLFFETVTQDDEGQYVCEARNGIGVGLSAVLYLTINAPVHFKVRSRKEMVRRGGTAVLRCQALGDMPITFAWRKEGSFMDLQRRSSVKNITGGLESELRVNAVNSEDGGIYTCFARNGYGHDQTTIHLLVQDAPEHPTNLRVLDQSSRRVTVAWTPAQDGNSPITRYLIRYSPMKDAWAGPSLETVVEGGQSSALLAGLQPATTYSVRVLAENTLGPGAASNELLVRTAEEAPSAAPLRLSADARSSTQVALAFDPPPPDAWNGPLLGHYVGHRLLGDTEGKRQYNFTTVPFHGAGREEVQLNDLKKFSKYALVAQAFNTKGPGPLSDEVIAQTLEDVPEASPRDVRCTALSPESLQVSWQPPPETLVHGVIQGYRLFYEPMPTLTQEETVESRTKITTALTTVLHGLMKYTNYSVEILAFTRIGDGVRSSRTYCRTKEDAPGPPSSIKAALSAPDAALVAWLPPARPNGVLSKYHVYVRAVEGGGRQVDARSVVHAATAPLQFQLPGLRRQLRYEFWVTAFTKVGEGKSTPVAAVTPAAKVSASIVSFGEVRVTAWRSDVRLPCEAVGIPEPSRRWQRPGDLSMSQQPRAHVLPDGALLLSNVQRSDQGEYVCQVSNDHGSDHITYQLVVQAPSTRSSYNGSSGTTGAAACGGSCCTTSTSTASGRSCSWTGGAARMGTGDPSPTLNVRTRGAVPLRPQSYELFAVNSTSVQLHLHSWPDGGCPLLYFVVEYAHYLPDGEERWEVVGNNIATDKMFPLVGLNSGQTYKIKITAHNAAGSTVAQYKFKTLSEFGGTAGPSHVITRTEQRTPLHKDTKMVVLAVFSVLALVLSLLGVCFCLKKRAARSPSPHSSLQDMQANATQDNKHNLARSEKYYATIRKLSPSPGTLECIPEYSEDIRPYATFHVPAPPNSDTTKLQTFVYREDMSPSRKSMKSEYRRSRRPRPTDEYDSFGSESDTEPGTSSRTESSNQLDSGAVPGDLSRTEEIF